MEYFYTGIAIILFYYVMKICGETVAMLVAIATSCMVLSLYFIEFQKDVHEIKEAYIQQNYTKNQ